MTKAEFIEILKKIKNDFPESLTKQDLQQINYYISAINKKYEDAVFNKNISIKYDEKENIQRQKTFNGLTAKEWASFSRNVWNDVSSPRKKYHLKHGATYPKLLSDRIIKMYSKKGDLVFDPFLGTGVTMISAKSLERKGVGIELSEEFFGYAQKTIGEQQLFDNSDISIYNDDCRNLEKYLEDNSVQLTMTSPPYANFILKSIDDRIKRHKTSKITYENNSTVRQYTELESDFGNLNYKDFLEELEKLFHKIYKKTKLGGYSVWVVKDYRDTKNNIPYINFHSDLANIGESAGFRHHDLIVWDQNEQRKLILLGYPSVFYTNQNCSYLVVLRKS